MNCDIDLTIPPFLHHSNRPAPPKIDFNIGAGRRWVTPTIVKERMEQRKEAQVQAAADADFDELVFAAVSGGATTFARIRKHFQEVLSRQEEDMTLVEALRRLLKNKRLIKASRMKYAVRAQRNG